MTRVCLVGKHDVDLHEELFSRETSREALKTYDLKSPFRNTVAVETVSIGAAVSLLNDLNWYLVRFTDDSLVLEPSISKTEWLSRGLARAIRDDEIDPEKSDRFVKLYGVEDGRLVEPLYVTRTDGDLPSYDLRDVDATVPVRLTPEEFTE